MRHTVTIRPELEVDKTQIFRVVSAAFARDQEALLVDLIRDRSQTILSLVAVVEQKIVGHVLISRIRITGIAVDSFGGVAPLSVLPEFQTQGIGSHLMRSAIDGAKDLGLTALFLLGNPNYYKRFGFEQSHIGNEYGATDAFMHLEINSGSLSNTTGTAKYVEAFTEVGA